MSQNDLPNEKRIRSAARMYPTNRKASKALDIHPTTFVRLCDEYQIDTPNKKRSIEPKDDWLTFRRNQGIGTGSKHPFRRCTKT